MELRGSLFALRSDVIASEELLVEDDEDFDDMELETVSVVPLPEFEATASKAIYLGRIDILDGVDYSGASVHTGYASLPVTRWESVLVNI
jgi:hypothetical protein